MPEVIGHRPVPNDVLRDVRAVGVKPTPCLPVLNAQRLRKQRHHPPTTPLEVRREVHRNPVRSEGGKGTARAKLYMPRKAKCITPRLP